MLEEDIKPELGYLGKFDKDVRNQHYVNDICVPTPDENAAYLGRRLVLEQLVETHKPAKTLELGCHDGFMTRFIAKYPWCDQVVGVEINKNALAAAREIAEAEYSDKNLVYVDEDMFTYLETAEIQWDLIVISEVIEHFHMQEVINLIRLSWERLAPGGALFLSTPDIAGRYGKSNPDPEHINLFNAAVLEKLLDDVLLTPADVFKLSEYIFAWGVKE